MSPVPPRGPEAPPPPVVEGDRACVRCGYALRGVPVSELCPECRAPVADSLGVKLLKYCPEEYLARLHRGAVLVQTGIIVEILMMFVIVGASLAFPGAVATVEIVAALVWLAVSAVNVCGWWLLSDLDVGFAGDDRGDRARNVVRATVVVQAGASVLAALAEFLRPAGGTEGTAGETAWEWAADGSWLVTFAVQYFAAMLYLRWLAARVPDEGTRARAKVLMWLGPLLSTVGLLVLLLGPLVALVLYWGLVDSIRKRIRGVRGVVAVA